MSSFVRVCAAAIAVALTLSACAAPQAAAPTSAPAQPTAAASMAGMDHGNMDMSAPFDAMFIDGMIAHHEGAISMANQALKEAQRPEIKTLAEDIVKAQQAEITQMQEWRKAWYPDLKATGGLTTTSGMMMDMGPMAVPAGDQPFDIRFIDAMIPHHESAIMMAQMALQRAEKPEIKTLAEAIIQAQTAEIEQMKQWRAEWVSSK